jgi:hypothetical protein
MMGKAAHQIARPRSNMLVGAPAASAHLANNTDMSTMMGDTLETRVLRAFHIRAV